MLITIYVQSTYQRYASIKLMDLVFMCISSIGPKSMRQPIDFGCQEVVCCSKRTHVHTLVHDNVHVVIYVRAKAFQSIIIITIKCIREAKHISISNSSFHNKFNISNLYVYIYAKNDEHSELKGGQRGDCVMKCLSLWHEASLYIYAVGQNI